MKQGLKAAIAGTCCIFGSSACGDAMTEIRSGLKTLHQIQDSIAIGAAEASQFQQAILDRVTNNLELSPSTSLATREYQSALAELALIGGERKRMAALIRLSRNNGEIDPLLSGVEAYLGGHMEKAAAAFEHLEAMESGASDMGHFLALAKATALLETDLPKAREAFERALLLGPGTLVEEVALRRLATISLHQKDPELFVRCAILYLRRYSKSPFALEFMSNFVEGTGLVDNPVDIERLGELVATLPDTTGRRLLILAGERLLANGKIGLAALLVARLSKSAEDLASSAETRLLELLVDLKKDAAPEMLTFLMDVDQELAGSELKELAEIARHVYWNVHKTLVISPHSGNPASANPNSALSEFAEVDPVLARAGGLLEVERKNEAAAQ